MRTRLVELHIERALEGVEQDMRVLMDALQHPRGTGERAPIRHGRDWGGHTAAVAA
jgi:hypothetical protein